MKKYLIVIGVLILGVGVFFMFKDGKQYRINESAILDNYEVTLTKAEYDKVAKRLYVTFLVKNNNSYSVSLDANSNFRLYEISDVQRPNVFNTDLNIIKPSDSVYYNLAYNVEDKYEYPMYFYSGKKDNHIKFIIDKNSIKEI